MSFELRLKECRKRLKLTQSQVAEALGIERTRYAKWESGKARPGYESIIQLCSLFDTSADYLLGIIDDPTPIPDLTPDEMADLELRAAKNSVSMTEDELIAKLPSELQEAIRTLIHVELIKAEEKRKKNI